MFGMPQDASHANKLAIILRHVSFDDEATRAKLALLGFEATISDRTTDSGVLHRVRLGPYNQVESMNKARAKLLDNGVVVDIVRNQR